MKKDDVNPLEVALASQRKIPESVRKAVTHTADVLDLAWKTSQGVFGKQARPEHALMLLPTLLQQADAERQLLLAEGRARMEVASKSSARSPRQKRAP